MLPQKPPQPSCSYLPLKLPSVGIQISMLMIESLVGFDVMATRQNAGRPVRVVVEPGGVNDPLVCSSAMVTLACGSCRLMSWAHGESARAAGEPRTTSAAQKDAARSGAKREPMTFLPSVDGRLRGRA